MGLQDVFNSAVDTAFKIFADLIKQGTYILNVNGDGFEDVDSSSRCDMEVIVNGLSQRDLKNTKFYGQMKPTDTVIMVKGTDILKNGIRVRTSDTFSIDHVSYIQEYTIEDHETDPACALYLLLLREK